MTKVEELRKTLISELAAFQMTMFGEDEAAEEEVDTLILAVRKEDRENRERSDASARGDPGESGVA